MSTSERIEKALSRLQQRYRVTTKFTSEPKVKAVGYGPKVSFNSASLKMLNEDLNTRGGVLEDVLGLEDVFENTFSSPWPWPRSLKSSKIALSSARGQHFFLNVKNFVDRLKNVFLDRFFFGDRLKNFLKDIFSLENT